LYSRKDLKNRSAGSPLLRIAIFFKGFLGVGRCITPPKNAIPLIDFAREFQPRKKPTEIKG
jgi:hypothetical protein